MSTSNLVYSLDREIATFFEQTTATRSACDAFARDLDGGGVAVPVEVQGVCSYTVYAGQNSELVAQFRLEPFKLNMEIMILARNIYGHFAPHVSFHGQIGEDSKDKKPLYIYVMNRIPGISYLDFTLAHNSHVPQNSPEFSSWRRNLVADVARFFALSWKAPQDVDQTYRDKLRHQYTKDLELLLSSLPSRFHSLIQSVLGSLPAIMALPMVLLHKDFGVCNIIVDEVSCNLVGVVDWAEAEIAPFGLNLHSHQRLISEINLKTGWIRYDDYAMLEDVFWSTFSQEAGGLDSDTVRVVKVARILGLLLSCGFTSRLPNAPEPVPIQDDEKGAYNMRDLDGLLINPATRFIDLT
ncbi:hypothetical protein McanMca71_006107 [Microsporum canis]|uniref:Aminoglycoside phosphotransferase domain-containing protein n=1 Tax=Arthroderma otae (strain ATCC MYA-4605 / CBS 113480) TaxID=554155 RepID=C5FNH7_ARTOC|nr:conserved hypothetical protein [Microsporum canis CBS 113480]EEQ31591.1 conserved hypothetical protein [Microsporum canis CBS 113480]